MASKGWSDHTQMWPPLILWSLEGPPRMNATSRNQINAGLHHMSWLICYGWLPNMAIQFIRPTHFRLEVLDARNGHEPRPSVVHDSPWAKLLPWLQIGIAASFNQSSIDPVRSANERLCCENWRNSRPRGCHAVVINPKPVPTVPFGNCTTKPSSNDGNCKTKC